MITQPEDESGKLQPEDLGAAIILMKLKNADDSYSWAYVALAAEKMGDFLAQAGKPVDLEAYGKVLLRGEGAEPPSEAREYIYDVYGFDS